MRSLLSGLLVVLAFENATAQLEPWHIVLPDRSGPFHYVYSALGCWSESCIVAGIEVNDTMPRFSAKVNLRFWRSDDAGLTWRVQDPHMAPLKGENTGVRAVQMIDSLTIVGVGDDGLFFHSSDGGETWTWQSLDTGRLHAVHFSSRSTGVIVQWMSDRDLASTMDGGEHWKWHTIDTSFPGYWIWNAESLGGKRFRAIDFAAGPFYYTDDNWETVDRSMVFDTSDRFNVITNFRSLGENLVLAYGFCSSDGQHYRLSMRRSLDGGRTWSAVAINDTVIGQAPAMSRLDRPYTLLVGHNLHFHPGYSGLSRDSGRTWQFAPLSFDTITPTPFSEPSLIEVTPSGVAISICSVGGAGDFVSPTFVARTTLSQQSVKGFEQLVSETSLYPNPASTTMNVKSIDYGQLVVVYDILGHEVLHGKLDGAGHAQFDVSALPRGVYSVILKHNGFPLPIGKVAVVAR